MKTERKGESPSFFAPGVHLNKSYVIINITIISAAGFFSADKKEIERGAAHARTLFTSKASELPGPL
jgi:hypothetical protein